MKKRNIMILVLLCVIALFLCVLVSLAWGSASVNLREVIRAFSDSDPVSFEAKVIQARIPRTVFGLLCGGALAVSGALMQSITRNPIADPSILGVNTGASFFVVCGIAFFNIDSKNQYIWLAFLGAAVTAFLVYGLASAGVGGATPIKLALAGAAAGTALQSLVNTVMLPRSQVMDRFRFWQVGSIGGASWSDIRMIIPYLAVGFLLAFLLAPSLNALALGEEAASGLGVNAVRVRAFGALAGVLLCASSTALAGPIGFVGLMIPHLMGIFLGPDMRLILPFSAVGGGCLLLLADAAGRMLGRPGELESGIVTALAGAPVFILIIRKVKVSAL